MSCFNSHLSDSSPCRIGNKHQVKGYYRFINNAGVSWQSLKASYQQYSMQESEQLAFMGTSNVVLSVQDSTTLDYTGSRASKELGYLAFKNQRGFYLHNHLLMTDLGIPFGLYSQRFISREMADFGKSKSRKQVDIEQKESYRWLSEFNDFQESFKANTNQTFINICDREADIAELLQARRYEHIHYLIRSSSNRKTTDGSCIWGKVGVQSACFSYDLAIKDKAGERKASLEVRYSEVEIKATYRPKEATIQLKAQRLWIVETKEINVPAGIEGICWRLVTSVAVGSALQAKQLIDYYSFRWTIERFHYALKQTLSIENLQIQEPEALKKAIVIQSWTALKITALGYSVKLSPNVSIESAGFQADDYEIAHEFVKHRYGYKISKASKPTLTQLAELIAILGGHLCQKNKPIGIVCLARGYEKLMVIKEAYQIVNHNNTAQIRCG